MEGFNEEVFTGLFVFFSKQKDNILLTPCTHIHAERCPHGRCRFFISSDAARLAWELVLLLPNQLLSLCWVPWENILF